MAFGNYIPNNATLKLHYSQKRLQFTKFLMDHAPDAVFWVAPDARFLYVNDRLAAWLVFP